MTRVSHVKFLCKNVAIKINARVPLKQTNNGSKSLVPTCARGVHLEALQQAHSFTDGDELAGNSYWQAMLVKAVTNRLARVKLQKCYMVAHTTQQ